MLVTFLTGVVTAGLKKILVEELNYAEGTPMQCT
jgi:hypothetical protein